MIMQAATPMTANAATIPPIIAPIFTFFELGVLAVEVVIEVAEVFKFVGWDASAEVLVGWDVSAKVLVGWEAGVDSEPPALSAAETLKVLLVLFLNYFQRTTH